MKGSFLSDVISYSAESLSVLNRLFGKGIGDAATGNLFPNVFVVEICGKALFRRVFLSFLDRTYFLVGEGAGIHANAAFHASVIVHGRSVETILKLH